MTTRDIDTISTDPGGKTGEEWTQDASESIAALWALNGGMLTDVSGTNAISGNVVVPTGFAAYTDGLEFGWIQPSTNTGACTINLNGLGAIGLRDADNAALEAGALVGGRLIKARYIAADNTCRISTGSGTTNITVSGGLLLQKSAPSRLITAAGPATAETTVATVNFQCNYATSRVVLEGNVSRVTSSGSADPVGTVIKLYVDGVQKQSFTDTCQPSAPLSTPFYFEYEPGDTSIHAYSIKVSSTIAATYPKGSNVIVGSELGQNP